MLLCPEPETGSRGDCLDEQNVDREKPSRATGLFRDVTGEGAERFASPCVAFDFALP